MEMVEDTIWKAAEINLGEWCAFVAGTEKEKSYVFGLILGFTYLTGTKNERQYSRHFAPTNAPAHIQRGVGALSK